MIGFCAITVAHAAIESATTFNSIRILCSPTLLLAIAFLRLLALLLIVLLIAGRGRLRAYRRAVPQVVRHIDDQCGAWFETGEEVQFIAVITPDDDFLKTRLLILGYRHHLRTIGANNQRRSRDSYRRLGQFEVNPHSRVHTWQKLITVIPGVRDPHLGE